MRTRRRWLALAPLLLLLPPGAHAQAPPGGVGRIPTVTRLVQLFTGLETEWLDAVRRKDEAVLGRLLADDFELRNGASPGEPVPRADWLHDAIGRGDPRSFVVSRMAVRELGDVAIVSFLCAPESGDGREALFVVDAWVRKDGQWTVKARYAAPAAVRPAPPSGKKTGAEAAR